MRITVKAWIIQESQQAYQISTLPQNRDWKAVWIPKSMCERITKGPQVEGEWRHCEIDMQDWFAEKKGLL